MKTLLFFITICWSFNLTNTYSQVPGYQGKRFFLELGGSFFFNTATPTINNKGPRSFPIGDHTDDITFRSRYHLSLYYTISRKHLLKAAYNYQLSGLHLSLSLPDVNGYNRLFYHSYTHDINLGINIYHQNITNLAPLGFY